MSWFKCLIASVFINIILFCPIVSCSDPDTNIRSEGPLGYTDPYRIDIPSHAVSSDSVSSDINGDDDICDSAIVSYYPSRFSSESSRIRPYLMKLLKEKSSSPKRDDESIIKSFRRAHSESTPRFDSDSLRIQSLLLEAAHQALTDKEDELNNRISLLRRREAQLEKKMSKKYSAAITTAISTFTTFVGALTVYLLK